MRVRYLGWAGVEIEAGSASVVIDPLMDAAAVFSPLVEELDALPLPRLTPPAGAGSASAALLTHLHRDHADAAALTAALASGAPVFRPAAGGGGRSENAGLLQAEAELTAEGLHTRVAAPWETITADPFTFSALPAADGIGDPQLSWVVEAEGRRVVHLGDTMFHGWWWRSALRHGPFDLALLPVNGARLRFPHRHPASSWPAVMDPDQAAMAAELLGARIAVPIHHGAYATDPFYAPVDRAEQAFLTAAAGRPYEARVVEPGDALDL